VKPGNGRRPFNGWRDWLLCLAASAHCSVIDAAAAARITDYALILVDCDDAIRKRRLTTDRSSPDLANASMMNWAKSLRDEAKQMRCRILDIGLSPLDVCVEEVWAQLAA